MKKLLTFLLIVAMAATLFAGCKPKDSTSPTGSETQTPTPSNVEPTVTPTGDPTGSPTTPLDPDQIPAKNDIIEFTVLDKQNYMTRWNKLALEYMKEQYKLVPTFIPRPTIEGVGTYGESSVLLPTSDIAQSYTENLELIFMTTPIDYMPSLYGTVTGCPAAKTLGKNYFVNLAPYLESGKAFQLYVDYLWADDKEYFEKAKEALMTSDNAIYALPRREMMPVTKFLGYNKQIFSKASISWDNQPKTWDEFISLLKKLKADEQNFDGIVPFIMTEARLENLLGFIASTYGLDFNVDFDWTEKNGEPLWTYFWADYLEILEKAREMGEDGLTMTDKLNPTLVVHYDLDDNSKGRATWARGDSANGWRRQGEVGNSVAIYASSLVLSGFNSSGWDVDDNADWCIADNWIQEDGRQFSLIGGTQFSQSYIAIGNAIDKKRGDKEFTLRILEFLSSSLSEEGEILYYFGKQGTPFGETLEDCGNWVWDINPVTGEKAIRWSSDDRLGFNAENNETLNKYLNEHKDPSITETVKYKRPDGKTDRDFWVSIDPNYALLIDKAKGNWSKTYSKDAPKLDSEEAYGVNYKEYATVDFTTNVYLKTIIFGTDMHEDVTYYPMQKTVYWDYCEGMAQHKPKIDKLREDAKNTNSYIYKGFYRDASWLGTTDASKLQQKMDNIKTIAREFTIGFLSNERQSTDWANYINSLREAGYEDVYNFYSGAGKFATQTNYVETTMSQSKVEEYRKKN